MTITFGPGRVYVPGDAGPVCVGTTTGGKREAMNLHPHQLAALENYCLADVKMAYHHIEAHGYRAFAEHADRIERIHMRLRLFMGKVWADQLIIAINNIAKKSPASYADLIEEAAAIAIQCSGD
ncbi:hypothetical protein D3C87_1700410 [compost metagenome]